MKTSGVQPEETRYFFLEIDSQGRRLNGNNDYTITFPAGRVPPVNGFWSLTLYNPEHFFAPNDLGRYSLGTKNKSMTFAPDGASPSTYSTTHPEPHTRTVSAAVLRNSGKPMSPHPFRFGVVATSRDRPEGLDNT